MKTINKCKIFQQQKEIIIIMKWKCLFFYPITVVSCFLLFINLLFLYNNCFIALLLLYPCVSLHRNISTYLAADIWNNWIYRFVMMLIENVLSFRIACSLSRFATSFHEGAINSHYVYCMYYRREQFVDTNNCIINMEIASNKSKMYE